MGRGSRVASGLDDLDSSLTWLWCFAALLTNKDPAAAAAAGYKELFFGVPGWVACVWAAAGAGGKDKEGIPHFQPCCLLFSVQLSRLRRALPLGQGLEAVLSGWAMGHGSRVASGLDHLDTSLNRLW